MTDSAATDVVGDSSSGSTRQPFTHLDATGAARMVDVTEKQPTVRSATASGFVRCSEAIVAALRDGSTPKGDVLAVARIAGIQGAKRTSELLPLAHVIGVHGAAVDLEIVHDGVRIGATVRTADRTGVEMEALTAVSVAALAVVDMVKGLDKSVSIEHIRLERKTGGKSGDWLRGASTPEDAVLGDSMSPDATGADSTRGDTVSGAASR
ncbi:cyclic pyranopterin monophosphate synthase MoaC [Humibacter antri]